MTLARAKTGIPHPRHMLLESDPELEFFPALHRYRFRDKWLVNSVTRVISDLTPEQQARIDATKDGPDGWAIRGNTVHGAMEQMLLYKAGVTKDGLIYDNKWAPWIDAMVDHWLWDGCSADAVELRLCDPRKSLGGSLDFVITDKRGHRVLGDVKTVKSESAVDTRKAASAQLVLKPVYRTHATCFWSQTLSWSSSQLFTDTASGTSGW